MMCNFVDDEKSLSYVFRSMVGKRSPEIPFHPLACPFVEAFSLFVEYPNTLPRSLLSLQRYRKMVSRPSAGTVPFSYIAVPDKG